MFFTTIFSFYFVINIYVFIRGWQAVPRGWPWRAAYTAVFCLLFSAFILARFMEHRRMSLASEILTWVGSFWLAAMLYFVLVCLVIDLARLVNHFLPFFPAAITADCERTKAVTLAVSIVAVALLVAGGYMNTFFIRTRTLDLDVAKEVTGPKTLRIGLVSDIHLGGIVGASRLNTIVAKINALNPELVILAGDIIDEDLTSAARHKVGEALASIRAPLGVVAVTGNHEYIGGIGPAVEYLGSHNVRLLRDEVIKVRDDIYVIGREDGHHSLNGVKPLSELMAEVDKRCPVILVDHQPRDLEESASEGVDVELCGHTHNGQLWPWNYLIFLRYEIKYGYRRIGNMHLYVTSGAGTWGPPVRVGTSPEVVGITLHFK